MEYTKTSIGVSQGNAWHITLHTKDGDRYLADYDIGAGIKKRDKIVKKIDDFIAGKTAYTLIVHQADRIIALSSFTFPDFQHLAFAAAALDKEE